MNKKIRSKQNIGAILLAWIAVIGFDFFLHAGALSFLYYEENPFLLPPKEAFNLIPLGYLSFFVMILLIVWLMDKFEIHSAKDGFLFGLKIGGLIWGSMILGLLSISTAPIKLMVGWFSGQVLEAGIIGLIIVLYRNSKKRWRMTLYLSMIVIALFILVVFLQSLEIVPTIRF